MTIAVLHISLLQRERMSLGFGRSDPDLGGYIIHCMIYVSKALIIQYQPNMACHRENKLQSLVSFMFIMVSTCTIFEKIVIDIFFLKKDYIIQYIGIGQ